MKEKILSQLLKDVISVEFNRKYLYSWEWKFKTEEQKGKGKGEGRREKERRGKRGKERKGKEDYKVFLLPAEAILILKDCKTKVWKTCRQAQKLPPGYSSPPPKPRANGLNYFCRAGKTSCPEQRPLARWRLILRIQASQNWKRISLFLIINW